MFAEAVLLAAGLGRRIRSLFAIPKFAIPIEKTPLIKYPISSLINVGVKRIIVVVARKYVDEAINVLAPVRSRAEIVVVANPRPEWGNGYSLILALPHITSSVFLISMCDHIYQSSIPRRILETLIAKEASVSVGGDRIGGYIEVEEATKILVDMDGRVLSIGKMLRKYTHIDVGVIAMEKRFLKKISTVCERSSVTVTDIINLGVRLGYDVVVGDVTGSLWTEIDTPIDYLELIRGRRRKVLERVRGELGFVWEAN